MNQRENQTVLPDADELPELLLDLAVPHEDINELVGLRRVLARDPGALKLLEECVEELVGGIGTMGDFGDRPRLAERVTDAPPALGPYFSAYVFVAALPHIRAHHLDRGIPADISRHTLADLGRNMAVHRRRHGSGGVQAPQWLTLHFRGLLYQLGRLQFQRVRFDQRAVAEFAAAGLDATRGTPCLNLHIADFRGPLSPAACDRSLALAREFFARHYPQERYETAVCHSWLLDPQLKRYLPADSNIVRFQERFRITHENHHEDDGDQDEGRSRGQRREPSDTEPVQFVFGNPDLPVETLPRRTAVERAVGDHLRAGRHWYIGQGWFPL